jgi:arylsulfatase A-like enzyme
MRAVAVVLLLLLCAGCTTPREQKPNVVFVLVDDMNARLLPYLPKLRRLMPEHGMWLDMTVTTPVCTPSRATILTGKYAHNTAVKSNGVWVGGIWAFRKKGHEGRTFAVWLRDAGYRTGMFGKYLNGHDGKEADVPQGWDRWVSYKKVTLSRYDGEAIEDSGAVRAIGKQYDTDYFADAAVQWVETTPEPFFAMWSPMTPHGPFVPPPAHEGSFDRVDFRWPPSFSADPGEVTKLTRTRLAMMRGIEEGLERLIGALEERGILDRTYIVFTSDHGVFMGEHGFPAGKGEPFEETTRVPLYVRGPGVPIGTSDALVTNADLAPTFAAIAGARVPDDVDGRSILPLLHGQDLKGPRQRVLLEWFDRYGPVDWQGVRTRDRKFIRYADGTCKSFDLAKDPYEMESGPCDDEFARTSDAILLRLGTCAGAECLQIESE